MTLCVLIALPALAAVVIVLIGHRSTRTVQLVGCLALALAWGLAVWLAVEHLGSASGASYAVDPLSTGGLPVTPALAVDQLTASMLLLAITVALLVQLYSVGFMARDPRYPSYSALILLFTSAMALVVAADDLFVLLVGWEVMGVCSYFLISHYWEVERAREGAVKAFVMTRLGDVGLLFGIFVAGEAAGTYRISGVLQAVADGRVSAGEATGASLLMLCGVVGKSAQFPLHSWLPDAMPGPTPITALIHAATMVAAGVYLVARLLPLFALSQVTMDVLASIAVVTLVGAAAFALVADDLKRVLAWSTVSQLAYMFAALSLDGYDAGVLHLLSHGAFKALLFLAAGSVIAACGTQRLADLGGLWRALPLTFATMTAGFAALAGVPPFVGFFSKDAVLAVAWRSATDGSARAWVVLVGCLLGVALTAAYAMRAWLMVFFGHRAERVAEEPEPPEPREPSPLMTVPLVVLALATTLGGALVLRPHFLGVESEAFMAGPAVLSIVLALGGAAATYARWRRLGRRDPAAASGRLRGVLSREGYVDATLGASVVRGTRLAVRGTQATEVEVVAPYVRGTDATAQLAARVLRWLHGGDLTGYLTAVVVGAVAVALLIGAVQG